MKKKMNALFLLVLIMDMALGVFTGCYAQRQNGVRSESGTLVTIDFWFGAASSEAGPPPVDWKAVQIVRDKLNINWRLTMLPSSIGDRDVKINAAAAANALPDMFLVSREILTKLIQAGLVAAVDDLYPLIPTWYKLYGGDDGREYATFNGKSYAIAYMGGGQPKNEGMLIRKDWLDRLGLKIPVTTNDYLNVMRAFTFNDPDGNGQNDTYGFGAFLDIGNNTEGLGSRMDPFFGAFGAAGTWNLTNANPGLNVRKPAYFEALSYIKTMVDEKIIDPNWLTYRRDDFRASWKQGRFGIMRENHSAYASESNYAPFDKNFPNGEWIVLDPPKGPRGEMAVGCYTGSFGIIAISAKAIREGKGPAIAKLFEWMATDEAYYLLGWGELGINYNLDANGIPEVDGLPDPDKAYTKPNMIPFTQLRGYIQRNSDNELVSRYPTYKAPASGKTMSALVTLRDMQRRPWVRVDGVDTLPTPSTDLKRFYEQGVIEFVTGVRPLNEATWNAWVVEFDRLEGSAWEEAGIEIARSNGYLR
jgi:putative aldouronate transport system substrate-binding protein